MNYYESTPSPLTGRVAAIEAHADDAAAMMSSALLSARIQGATLYGVTATDGQWANKRRGFDDIVSGRQVEAQRGWRDLGVAPARQKLLSFEDGTLSQPTSVLKFGRYLTDFALRHDINTFVTMGDFGGDAHPDHIASHHAALLAQSVIRHYRDAPLTVLGLSESVGDLEIPVVPDHKIRLLGHYASQFEIASAERAPHGWSRFGNYAISAASLRELTAYSREIFEAEHYRVST
jgi:LmbE family N-acetylglucosaminyl deacetylase